MLKKCLTEDSRVDVYIAALPKSDMGCELYPKERHIEVEKTKNEEAKRQKYFVWRLLEHALWQSFGLRSGELSFEKTAGRWYSSLVDFSLSHSHAALAVAVSRGRVGIDIEAVGVGRHSELAARFFTDGEMTRYLSAPDDKREAEFVRIWTAKEALFKRSERAEFIAREIDSESASTVTDTLDIDGMEYVFSVAADDGASIRIYKNVII